MHSSFSRAFIAGSAYPVVLFPFALLSLSSLAKPDSGFKMEYVVWFFPLCMGFWNVLFINIRKQLPFSHNAQYWLWGSLLGLIFPLIGNLSEVPGTLWGLHFPYGLLVIPLAMIAYSVVWRFPVKILNSMLGLDEYD